MNLPNGIRVTKRSQAAAAAVMSPGRTAPAPQTRLDMADLEPAGVPTSQDSQQTSPLPPPFDVPDFNLDHFSASTSPGIDAMVADASVTAFTTSLSFPLDMPSLDLGSINYYMDLDQANGNDRQLWRVPDSPKLTEPRLPSVPPRRPDPTDICRQELTEEQDVCVRSLAFFYFPPRASQFFYLSAFVSPSFAFAAFPSPSLDPSMNCSPTLDISQPSVTCRVRICLPSHPSHRPSLSLHPISSSPPLTPFGEMIRRPPH